MNTEPDFIIKYVFSLKDSRVIEYNIRLDPETYQIKSTPHSEIPYWCKLDYMRCSHCTKSDQEKEYCPIALNLVDIIEVFKDILSFEIIDAVVETNQRKYVKNDVSVQEALSSLVGIIMVTSGCSNLDKLRPMVKFHLPFASVEETVYRATSMYMLAQYFRAQEGKEIDLSMRELIDLYHKINQINITFCKRLQEISEANANLNAIVILDTFSQMIPMKIEKTLEDFKGLFANYLS